MTGESDVAGAQSPTTAKEFALDGQDAKEEKLPRRWTELILRLNDMERSKAQDRKRPQAR